MGERQLVAAVLLLAWQAGNAVAETSPVDRRIELEREVAANPFAILPHRPNYILFANYNGNSPNQVPFDQSDSEPVGDLDRLEMAFQISIKLPVATGLFNDTGDLYVAYTNRSYWQFYNTEASAPFRETNHEPEIWMSIRTGGTFWGVQNPLLRLGINHQSNGRAGGLSRSWNRVYVDAIFVKENAVFSLRPWWRIPENSATDDNPDIGAYMGNFELRAAYTHGERTWGVLWRNNFRVEQNRGAAELTYSFPVSRHIRGLLKWFNGYGESLIDYDASVNRLGLGILITDWL